MPPRRRNEIQENQQQRRNEQKDFISCLPEDLLHHILSFVDMKLAVQTSILSKRWRNVWASLGSITINENQFYSSTTTTRSVLDFMNFVDQVFILRDNSTIDVFNFTHYYQEPIVSRLYDWITSVTRRRVQEMYLRLCSDFVPPNCLLSCHSLIALALALAFSSSTFNMERLHVRLPDSMDLPKLKSLLLGSVVFDNERLTNKLFLSCPKLERLFLGDVEFQGVNVDIFSHTLVELGVNNHIKLYSDCHWIDSKFKLHAPNLKVFECKDFMSRDYILENLNSLISADIDMKVEQYNEKYRVQLPPFAPKRKQMYGQRMMRFLRAVHKVENLKLSAWFLEVISGSPDLLDCQHTQFYSLKCLKLETWLSRGNIRAITYLLQISPILESLFLEITKIKLGLSNIGEDPEAEVLFQCLLDKLVLVEIRGVVGCVNELLFLGILLKNARVLKKLVVYISKEDAPNREERMMKFNEKLLTFQKASSDVKILYY